MTTGETQGFDVVVIGGGPGGYVAAIRASQLGLSAAVVEREELGGICLNWGCIPSKAMLRGAEVLDLIHHAKDFGISVGDVTPDFDAALARARSIVDTQVKGVAFLMKKNKITVFKGEGKIARPGLVSVAGADGNQQIVAKNIIVATGSRTLVLPGFEVDGQERITSKEIWHTTGLPQRVVIIGGGAIGVEFASVFAAYGVKVTIVEMLPRILPLEDEEVSATLAREFAKRKIEILTNAKFNGVEKNADSTLTVKLVPAPTPTGEKPKGNPVPETIVCDRALMGVGFLPNSAGIGLEEVGVELERGFIKIDDQMRTNVPGIYAIGDVTGKLRLAHVASAMGVVVAEAIAGQETHALDYNAMPRCTYSSPQIASIGLTEAQVKEKGIEYKVGKYPFRPNGKAQALGESVGQAKIIVDAKYGEILGAHLIGPDVTELIGEFSLAYMTEATVEELGRAVHPHPTLSEVIMEAAEAAAGHAINI